MRYIAEEPLCFEPGARWQYSLCHDAIAALVEVLSGEKFEDYVKKHIFDVAGMERSTFMLPESEIGALAPQYSFRDGRSVRIGEHIDRYKLGTEYASGGAGCISTVDDYMRFLEGLRTFVFLRPETVRLMTTDRLNEAQRETFWHKGRYGYGLGVRCPLKGGKFSDFGWGGAACAYLAIDLPLGLSLYFGTHLLASPVRDLRPLIYRFVRAELAFPDELDQIRKDLEAVHTVHLPY
jgi:CubicO group peptidase (beta-lactamase class C family)